LTLYQACVVLPERVIYPRDAHIICRPEMKQNITGFSILTFILSGTLDMERSLETPLARRTVLVKAATNMVQEQESGM